MKKEVIVRSILRNQEKSQWCKLFVEQSSPSEKHDLITNTYSCFSSDWEHEDIEVFTKKDDFFDVDVMLPVFGCRKCKACFRRFAAISGTGMFVPFEDLTIAQSYVNKINKKAFPERYKSTMEYIQFLNYINAVDQLIAATSEIEEY